MSGVYLAAGGDGTVIIPDFGGPSGGAHGCIAKNGLFCTTWVKDHWGDILQPALVEHVELTVIAVAIGFAIALRRSADRRTGARLVRDAVRRSSRRFLYTIPSLALFQLLVPFTGLTVTTIEIGLVGYTLLILFRNILAGLRDVPEDVLEAARGMGLAAAQILGACRAAARAAGDHRRASDRGRDDDQPRHRRRVRHAARARQRRSSTALQTSFKHRVRSPRAHSRSRSRSSADALLVARPAR